MAAVQEVHGDLRVERRRGRRIDRGEWLESDQVGQEPPTQSPPGVPSEFEQGMDDHRGQITDPASFPDFQAEPEPPAVTEGSVGTPTELPADHQAAAQGVRRMLTGRLDPKVTDRWWSGPHDASEIVSFSARPTTGMGYVQGSVTGVWRLHDSIWYRLEIHNPHTTPTEYEVIAADSSALR
jgi:hypothetical protein